MRDNSSKFSPGPRFEPPPGKDHEFANMDLTHLQKVTPDEDKTSHQQAKLSNKLRSDEGLTIQRSSFLKRPLVSNIREAEEGQVGFDSESVNDNVALQMKISVMAENGPLSPKNQSCSYMDVDETIPSSTVNGTCRNHVKITCSMLGDNDTAVRAMNTIKIMSTVMDNCSLHIDSSTSSPENVPLPEAEELTRAVQELQKKVKQGQQQLKLTKFKMKRSIQEDMQKKKEQELGKQLQREEEQDEGLVNVTDIHLTEYDGLGLKEDDDMKRNHERMDEQVGRSSAQ
jgi:hypothetical protein